MDDHHYFGNHLISAKLECGHHTNSFFPGEASVSVSSAVNTASKADAVAGSTATSAKAPTSSTSESGTKDSPTQTGNSTADESGPGGKNGPVIDMSPDSLLKTLKVCNLSR